MALLFMDSFNHYATADITEKWTQICTQDAGNPVVPTIGAYGRNSSQGLRTNLTTNTTYVGLPVGITVAPADAVCVVGFAVKYSSFSTISIGTSPRVASASAANSSNWIAAVRDTNTYQVWFRVNQNGTISAMVGDTVGSTELGVTSLALQIGVFHYVEIKVIVDSSAGTIDIKIDGASGLSLDTQNTQTSGNAAWNEVRVGYLSNATTGTHSIDYDDLVIMDGSGARNNDFLGDVTIGCLYPDGAGTTTGWTPSAGDNYANVDEALVNDDTDYNSTNVLNAKDTYSMADVTAGANIKAIQIVTSQRKAAEGPGKIKHVVRSSGTDYDQTEQGIGGTTYSFLRSIVETDPATGVAWDEAGFNAVEIGLKKTG